LKKGKTAPPEKNRQFCRRSSHHVRDVSMGEDSSRIRRNPHIFAKLRSFALNILRKNNMKNVSRELFRNCINIDRLFDYAGIF
jgi:hypothetical protein